MTTPRAALRGTVAVAYSAGRDSTALLHATAVAAAALGLQVVALHVHHGLMPQADDWLATARRQCARWQAAGLPVKFVAVRLATAPAPGDSVEAWARRERRAALARMAQDEGAGLVLLAQHRRDQAETVLLQALRGAGSAGLAAMPRAWQAQGLSWARPWLDQPREAIDAYVRTYRLRHVDDTSNVDPRFARSRLRQQMWPALVQAFPDAEVALAAVARRAQEADAVLDLHASVDLAALIDGDGLRLTLWRTWPAARQRQVLRAWLHERLGQGAAEALVQRLGSELPGSRAGRWPVDRYRMVVLYRHVLQLRAAPAARPAEGLASVSIDLSRPGRHALPAWGGVIEVRRARRGGVDASALRACELRARRGGERFQSHAAGSPRGLKKQYQSAGVPQWERSGPLVLSAGRLLYVPGLGIDARWLQSGEGGLTLAWRPDPPGLLQRNS